MDKFIFLVTHYALLGAVLLSLYGWGYPATWWMRETPSVSMIFGACLRLAAGLGIAILLLIPTALLGWLTPAVVLFLLVAGVLLNFWRWKSDRSPLNTGVRALPPVSYLPWVALVVAVILPLLPKPLMAPHDWDTLAYHLPHARAWAEHGGLPVNDSIRFPLIPLNMQLMYSAFLVFGNDLLPQLLNAATAALSMLLLFAFAQRWMDRATGVMALLMLVFATRGGWSSANVDFAVMLFWFCAFAALAAGHESGDRRLLYLSALFAGLAVGVKTQALLYLPVYGLLFLILERRPLVILKAVLILILAGSFWYLRSFVVSGNPVHPVAGQWFGHWLWNAADLEGLNNDLYRIRGWPYWYLVCAAFAAVYWRSMSPKLKIMYMLTALSVLTWAVVVGHPRYLSAMYPFMSLLSAYFFVEAFRRSKLANIGKRFLGGPGSVARRRVAVILSIVFIAMGLLDASKGIRRIAPDEESRQLVLREQFKGYDLLQSVPGEALGTLYQLGFEGEFYHLGEHVIGDWFGPARYADVAKHSRDAAALAEHLEALGADSLLINHARAEFTNLTWDKDMSLYFDLLARSSTASLYRFK